MGITYNKETAFFHPPIRITRRKMNSSNDSPNGKMWAGLKKYTFLIHRQFMCVSKYTISRHRCYFALKNIGFYNCKPAVTINFTNHFAEVYQEFRLECHGIYFLLC